MSYPTIRQLEYALAVAKYRKFTDAAQSVHISQPTLSSQIAELENRLGVLLFERSAKQVNITPAGQEIIACARRILQLSDELSQIASRFKGVMLGTVRFAAIPTMAPYLLPQVVQILRTMWPESKLILLERQSDQLLNEIGSGEVDLGLLALPYETGSLKVIPVCDEPFYLALPDDHPLADHKSPLPLNLIKDFEVMLLEPGHCLRDHVLSVCVEAGHKETTEIHSTSLSTLTQMVANRAGVTLLPAFALGVEVRPGNGITAKPFKPPVPFRTIALAWRGSDPRDSYFTEFARAFKKQLRASSKV